MNHHKKFSSILLLFLLSFSSTLTALAYEDEYISVALGANGCVTRINNGERIVYVFSNIVNTATVSSTITMKETMTLAESLIVGGGGAGGAFKGGGGGGGGVVYSDTKSFVSAGSEVFLTVGAGGIGNTEREAAKPQNVGAGYGSPSSLTLSGVTTTAYGGGGGGSDASTRGVPSKITNDIIIGSGGGAGAFTRSNQTGEYYTPSQGNYGGMAGSATSAGTGGGGGAGSPGMNGTYVKSGTSTSGNGGEGATYAITGVNEVYGSGGGGGGAVSINTGAANPGIGGTNAGNGSQGPNTSTPTAGAGVPGFGGGGGGGGYNGSKESAGGNGGSGTVILSFTVGGQAGQPTIDPDAITVEYADGYTQPNISVTLGGDEGAVYTASLAVYSVIGSAEAADGEWTSTNVYEGLHLGDTSTGFATVYPLPGETFTVKVIASAEGVADAVTVKTFTVPTNEGLMLPPYLGKGGGSSVIHVRLGARGRGTGESWTDAYTDFRDALKLISEDRPELWFSGSDTLSSATATTISITNSAAIRGGFTGVENSIAERPQNSYSTIDGVNAYTAFTIANSAPATVDGFWICRGARGLTKSGAGDITVTNCVFDSNGPGGEVAGRAMQLKGNAASTRATVVDSIIMRHYEINTGGTAGAVYLDSLHEATVSACLFASNGLSLTTRTNPLPGRSPGTWGGALAINGVKTLVENCQFRANVVPTIVMDGRLAAGGIARLRGNAGGSVFRNCLFAGNASIYGRNLTDSYPDPAGGALVVDMTAGQTVQVENCTFAYNIHSGENSAASLTVVSGAAAVTNTIFTGSICTTGRSSGHGAPPGDIMVASGAAATIGFSLMSGAENRVVAEGGELVVGEGCIDAEALLVTEFSALSPYIYTGGNPGFRTTAGAAISAINAHLRGGRGYFDERTNRLNATYKSKNASSPAIDAGASASDYAQEPDTSDGWHGRRINIGFYGNTPWATLTPFNGSALYLR